jgi:hypothetical protein
MACIGIYYGIPSLVLRRDRLKDEVTAGGAVVLAVLLLALFFLYPPLQNQNFNISSTGVLDRIVGGASGDPGRIVVFSARPDRRSPHEGEPSRGAPARFERRPDDEGAHRV